MRKKLTTLFFDNSRIILIVFLIFFTTIIAVFLTYQKNFKDISLIITGGLRTAADFVKALAMGADAIAISNSAMQSIGCVGARMCNTNNCPAGIATQKPELRKNLNVDVASKKLSNFLIASTDLMKTLARACGHKHLSEFTKSDLTTWKLEMSKLSGVNFSGLEF